MKRNVLDAEGNCKQCGSRPTCQHGIGSSGNDVVDDFRLICPQCGEIDQYVHVDMGNDQETCPWCDGVVGRMKKYTWHIDMTSGGNTLKADWNKIHLVDGIDTEEDPAGCDGDVYVSRCGKRFQAWSIAGSPMPVIGLLIHAQKTGLEFCEDCKV